MRLVAVALAFALALAAPAVASPPPSRPPTYDLVEARVCLAGSWGQSTRHEWRVQLAVFDDDHAAARASLAAAARGIAAESYLAAWLARGDREPTVIVSPAFPTRAAAERAARLARAAFPGAFARSFTRWVR